ncbi:MAG: hypothetical protein ABI851_05920 [Saprospiraceae bacterium]
MDKNFEKLISYFPIVQLPFTLEKGVEHDFGMTNDMLPATLFEELMAPNLPFELDEFTELLPGYHWRTESEGFVTVFWVARLLRYSFFVFSYDKEGKWLDNAEIAGLIYENNELWHRIANISDAQTIYVVEASMPDENSLINASETSKWMLEITTEGIFKQFDASDM